MSTERTPITNLEAFKIAGALRRPGLGELDPITVILQDHGDGRGTLIVTCYASAWTCYWGAIDCTLREFLRGVNADYVATNLVNGRRGQMSQRKTALEESYLTDIASAIIGAIRSEAARG